MSKVYMLGLAALPTQETVYDGRFSDGEAWVLNDWYSFYPRLQKPDRIYQPHSIEDIEIAIKTGRYKGNWRDHYEKSGALIITLRKMGFSKERIFDCQAEFQKRGKDFFGSALSYMFADAIAEGIAEISLIGVQLRLESEYAYQIYSMLKNIEAARDAGIKVHAPMENSWRARSGIVDWAKSQQVEGYGFSSDASIPKLVVKP